MDLFGRKRKRLARWEMRGYADGVERAARLAAREADPDNAPLVGDDTEPPHLDREERLAYEAGKARGLEVRA